MDISSGVTPVPRVSISRAIVPIIPGDRQPILDRSIPGIAAKRKHRRRFTRERLLDGGLLASGGGWKGTRRGQREKQFGQKARRARTETEIRSFLEMIEKDSCSGEDERSTGAKSLLLFVNCSFVRPYWEAS